LCINGTMGLRARRVRAVSNFATGAEAHRTVASSRRSETATIQRLHERIRAVELFPFVSPKSRKSGEHCRNLNDENTLREYKTERMYTLHQDESRARSASQLVSQQRLMPIPDRPGRWSARLGAGKGSVCAGRRHHRRRRNPQPHNALRQSTKPSHDQLFPFDRKNRETIDSPLPTPHSSPQCISASTTPTPGR